MIYPYGPTKRKLGSGEEITIMLAELKFTNSIRKYNSSNLAREEASRGSTKRPVIKDTDYLTIVDKKKGKAHWASRYLNEKGKA